MPPLSDKELAERLNAAGISLSQPPSSFDQLLHLLDRVEELLSKVEQSPPKSMLTTLTPLMDALVTEVLLKHSDIDVKVGVASCISEITRITAPDAPYDDDKMKDVFQLIVSSFENMSDVSSRSHEKRAAILETVAKVRSCVIMLDLECDQMIIDMFQYFLKAIRAYHAEIIFASMETIMTLVLEESEDISTELLAPFLNTLRRNNQDATPIARKLAERVIQNTTDKLRPYLRQAVAALDTSLDDYSEVVASVCQESTDTFRHSNESMSNQLVVEGKCTSASPDCNAETPAADKDGDRINFQDKDSTSIRSLNSVVINGVNEETGANEIITEANTSNKIDSDGDINANSTFKADQAQQEDGNHDTDLKDIATSPSEDKHVEVVKSLDKGEDMSDEAITETSNPVEALIEASPAQSGSHRDESLSETEIKETREKKFVDEEITSIDTAPKIASEKAVMKQWRSGKKQANESADKDKPLTEEVASKNDDACASYSERKSLDQVEKLCGASNKADYGLSLRKEDVKKSARGKPTFEKDTPKSSSREDHGKDTVTPRKSQSKSTKHDGVQEETPRSSTNRKLTPGKEKASVETGKNLVGSKVKVWWPKDRAFYEGVVESFDSAKNKHRVLYNDGDEEFLNLKRERWELLEDDDQDQDVEHSSHDTSSGIKMKKGRTSSEMTSKRQKVEGSPKSKQKDTALKSGGKFKDDGKIVSVSKENYPKPSKKSVDDKSKDQSHKVGAKGQVDSAKASGRSKEDVGKNLKQDNLRTPKSKGKTPHGGRTLGSGGPRTTKSSSSKVKETDQKKEKTPDIAKSSDTAKGKATDTAKSRESETKGGKKRKR